MSNYFVCRNCGAVGSKDDLYPSREFVGYCGDAPAYEDRACCPECGGDDFDDAELCSVCQNIVAKDEFVGASNICPECVEALANYDNAVKYGKAWAKVIYDRFGVEVPNLFYMFFFKDFNGFLEEYIKNNFTESERNDIGKQYCLLDKEDFAETIEDVFYKEAKEAKNGK